MQSVREGSRRRRLAQSGHRLGLPNIAGRAAKKGSGLTGAGAWGRRRSRGRLGLPATASTAAGGPERAKRAANNAEPPGA